MLFGALRALPAMLSPTPVPHARLSTATLPAAEEPPLARPSYQLSDSLWATQGQVFLTGTQALVRLLLTVMTLAVHPG